MVANEPNRYPLSEFQREPLARIGDLRRIGGAALLTVDGEAEAVLQTPEAYQELLDDCELLKNLGSVAKGLAQARRGEGRPMRQFVEELAARHGISLE